MKISQELDLNLYYLLLSLERLEGRVYPKHIDIKIKKLMLDIDSILFKPIPSGYDIVDVKCHYTRYLEKN